MKRTLSTLPLVFFALFLLLPSCRPARETIRKTTYTDTGKSPSGINRDELSKMASEKQQKQIEELKRGTSQGKFRAVVGNGQVEALIFEHKLRVHPEEADSIVDNSVASYLEGQNELLRIRKPQGELRLQRKAGNELRVYHYQQFINDIPVYGSKVKVVVSREKGKPVTVKSIFANYTPDLEASKFGVPELTDSCAKISFDQALDSIVKNQGMDKSKIKVYMTEGLSIYDKALFQPRCPTCKTIPHDPKLCWHIIFSADGHNGAVTDAFVDALNGQIIHIQARVSESRDINVYDFSNGNQQLYDNSSTCLVSFCPAEARTCFDAAVTTYNYYKNEHNRDSYDGHGTQIEIYVLINDFDGTPGNGSAQYWWTDFGLDQFQFEIGAPSLDVFAHEYTHGVHRWTSGYVYQNESGAIAEHIADAFAIMIGHWSGIDIDWRISNGMGKTYRDFQNPPTNRDEYSEYLITTSDNGAVHTNNNILNHAFFLMAHGGTFNGITVQPVDEVKLGTIYLNAMIIFLSSNSNFEEFAYDIMQTSRMLYPMEYAAVTCQILNAFAAIGLDGYTTYIIAGGDMDCDNILDFMDEDKDGDGVFDTDDNCPEVSNSSQTDQDSDGIGDACDDDIDGDGIANDVDNCPRTYNPAGGQHADMDGDGIGDACDDSDGDGIVDMYDNCPFSPNPSQKDLDGDHIGDECDNDIDGDGYNNNVDNCPRSQNTAANINGDIDGDGIGDICDDSDGDGWMDAYDNCPLIVNPYQEDLDHDGIGDVCDNDIDGDGTPNDVDNCPLIPNNQSENRDGDAYGDACDLCPDIASKINTDLDKDGIGDLCDADRDNDGYINEEDMCPDQYFTQSYRTIWVPIPGKPGCFDTLCIWPNKSVPFAYDYRYRFFVIPCDPLHSLLERFDYSVDIAIDENQRAQYASNALKIGANQTFTFALLDEHERIIREQTVLIKDMMRDKKISLIFSVPPMRALKKVEKNGQKFFLRIEEEDYKESFIRDLEPVKFSIIMKQVKINRN